MKAPKTQVVKRVAKQKKLEVVDIPITQSEKIIQLWLNRKIDGEINTQLREQWCDNPKLVALINRLVK